MFKFVVLAAASSFATGFAAIATNPTNLKTLLQQNGNKWSPNTQIFFPSDPNYVNKTTQRWNTYSAPSYVASIKPGTETDVQKVVTLAAKYNVSFLATGGGHGYGTTFGELQNGLEIDLGHFKTVDVDAGSNTMTIGGAVTFAEVFDPLYNAGKEVQMGTCSCVGMVGATLGAGVGRYQGLHGLILDALLSVRLVTATGDIITVSATEHSDLFWGLRGAGFNFGIVVSATYKIADLTNHGNVLNADLIFLASANRSLFEALKTFEDKLPAPFSIVTLVIYNATQGGPVIILNAVYAGPSSTGMDLIQPFLDLKPIAEEISTIPWNRLITTAGFGLDAAFCVNGGIHSMYGLGIKTIDVTTHVSVFDQMADFYATTPAARGSTLEMEYFPTQAVVAVPQDATAYPWRGFLANIMLQFAWTDSSVEQSANTFAKSLRAEYVATSGYDAHEVYVSYAHGDESLEQRYGASKLARLNKLKKQWDPQNLFGFDNGLPTS